MLQFLKICTIVKIKLNMIRIWSYFTAVLVVASKHLLLNLSSNEESSGVRYPASCVHATNDYRSMNYPIQCNCLVLNFIYVV